MQKSDENIRKALTKAGAYGSDVDLDRLEEGTRKPIAIDDLDDAKGFGKTMEHVGVVADDSNRAGTIIFIDNGMSHCSNREQEGVELMSTREALKKYSWAKDYIWGSIAPDKDKYTATTFLNEADGYFLRVKAGYQAKYPVQSCLLLNMDKSIQNLHNIVILEEGSSLEMISGCSTTTHSNDALHVGVTEMYIKDDAKLQYSMIHNWGKKTSVRPRTTTVLGKNAHYTSNYVLLNPVGSLQTYPVANLDGEGASATFNTMCLAETGSNVDTGSMVALNAKDTKAQIMSRSIVNGGCVYARGRLVGNAPGVKAHLECRSIVLNDKGSTVAIPELEAHLADVEMTHEAAVGKIARDQIEYLMSRGLSEDDAVSMIVKGFLTGSISGLPLSLQEEIDSAIAKANFGS